MAPSAAQSHLGSESLEPARTQPGDVARPGYNLALGYLRGFLVVLVLWLAVIFAGFGVFLGGLLAFLTVGSIFLFISTVRVSLAGTDRADALEADPCGCFDVQVVMARK